VLAEAQSVGPHPGHRVRVVGEVGDDGVESGGVPRIDVAGRPRPRAGRPGTRRPEDGDLLRLPTPATGIPPFNR